MLRINITLIIGILFSQCVMAQVQTGGGPCGGAVVELTTNGNSSQSTTDGIGIPSKAIDGITTGNWYNEKVSRTRKEDNPWWEVDLGDVYALQHVQVYYPADIYPNGLSNYYILISRWPFETTSLSEELASDKVESIHVNTILPTGEEIPLSYQSGRYLRIQLAEEGDLSFVEIHIPGGSTEICGNGKDDDCDGNTDCDDSDCAPYFQNVIPKNPTCPICDDGEIEIRAFDTNDNPITYSIDGGVTFMPEDEFFELPEGDYYIFITNGECVVEYASNPVGLYAPISTVICDCPNGDFESGDFSGWTGGYEGFGNESGTFNYIEGFSLGLYHSILQSSNTINDPLVGGDIPLMSPNGSLYFVKLGDTFKEDLSRLTYCFDVDASNRDFSFNYAFVMQDGDHSDSDQPFFEWRLLNSNGGTVDEGDRFFGDTNNSLYESDENLVWKPWDCESRDLISLGLNFGDEVCVEFTVRDCTHGGHFAYAYIDGICCDLPVPQISLDINQYYCENQDVIVEADAMFLSNYHWTVCRNTGTSFTQCFYGESSNGGSVPDFNPLDFFYDSEHDVDPLACNDRFQVTLTGGNQCGGQISVSGEFTYLCESNEIDYLDLLVCAPETDFTIESTSDCVGCTYQWDGVLLNSYTIANPTILGTLNWMAYSEDYNVSITNEHGCVYEETINVTLVPEVLGEIEIEVTQDEDCIQVVYANLTLEEPMEASALTAIFEVEANNPFTYCSSDDLWSEEYSATYTGVSLTQGASTEHKFRLVGSTMSPRNNYEITAQITVGAAPEEFSSVGGNCAITGSKDVAAGFYHGSIGVYVPNVFEKGEPTDDDYIFENNTFGPFFDVVGQGDPDANTFQAYNVKEAWLRVFAQNGALVYQGTAIAPPIGPGLSGYEPGLRWDGKIDGQWAQQGVFVWVLDYYNCDVDLQGCMSSCGTPWDGCCENENQNCWDGGYPTYYGDVTFLH